MGRQAKLKKLRKIFKDTPLEKKLDENFQLAQEKLISFNALPTAENVQALFNYLASLERPKNLTDDQFEDFLDKKMSDFIENNLK